MYFERKRHCWLSDGRLLGFFANLTLDGGLIRIRVIVRENGKDKMLRQKIIVCKGEFE